MSETLPVPQPLFDTIENIDTPPLEVMAYLEALPVSTAKTEYAYCVQFLKNYQHCKDTFTSYRRESERLLHWAWLICKKSLKEITHQDMSDYLQFIHTPPSSWMTTKVLNRFIEDQAGMRKPNANWRPFVVKVSKLAKRHGQEPDKSHYQLSHKSIEATYAVLNSFFSYLQQAEYLEENPIMHLRQAKESLPQQAVCHPIRKLTQVQWHYVMTQCEMMANENPQHERTLFLMSVIYLLGLRISELAYTHLHPVTMKNFVRDGQEQWHYIAVGKGDKIREILVPYALLTALQRYRQHLHLTPLPEQHDLTPLFPKQKGGQGLGSRQIRNVVQQVFDRAIDQLQAAGKQEEAEELAMATVHWLSCSAVSHQL